MSSIVLWAHRINLLILALCLQLLSVGGAFAQQPAAWHTVFKQPMAMQGGQFTLGTRSHHFITTANANNVSGGADSGVVIMKLDTLGNVIWKTNLQLTPTDTVRQFYPVYGGRTIAENGAGDLVVALGVLSSRLQPCFLFINGQTGRITHQKILVEAIPYYLHVEGEADGSFVFCADIFTGSGFATTLGRFSATGQLLAARQLQLYEPRQLVRLTNGWAVMGTAAFPSTIKEIAIVRCNRAFEPVRAAVIQLPTFNSRGAGMFAMAGKHLLIFHDSLDNQNTIYRPYLTCLDSNLTQRWSGNLIDSARNQGGPNPWAYSGITQGATTSRGTVLATGVTETVEINVSGAITRFSSQISLLNNGYSLNSLVLLGPRQVPWVWGQPGFYVPYLSYGYGCSYRRLLPKDSISACSYSPTKPNLLRGSYTVLPVPVASLTPVLTIKNQQAFIIRTPITCRVPACGQRLFIGYREACQFPVRITADRVFDNQRLVWSNGDTGQTATFVAPGRYSVQISTPCFSYADTFNIARTGGNFVNLPNDTLTVCNGDTLRLPAGIALINSLLAQVL